MIYFEFGKFQVPLLLALCLATCDAAVIEVTAGGDAYKPSYRFSDISGVHLANMTADGEGKIIASSSVAASDFQLRDGATMSEAVALVSVLNETVTQQQATISSLQGDITSMQTTIASMQATIATMQTDIAGKQNNLGLVGKLQYQTPDTGFWDNAWHRPNVFWNHNDVVITGQLLKYMFEQIVNLNGLNHPWTDSCSSNCVCGAGSYYQPGC